LPDKEDDLWYDGVIIGLASLERDNSVIYYNLCASEILPGVRIGLW
jgi:hypothetical protein